MTPFLSSYHPSFEDEPKQVWVWLTCHVCHGLLAIKGRVLDSWIIQSWSVEKIGVSVVSTHLNYQAQHCSHGNLEKLGKGSVVRCKSLTLERIWCLCRYTVFPPEVSYVLANEFLSTIFSLCCMKLWTNFSFQLSKY